MNVDEFCEVFTGGNHYTATWKPRAIKDFAEDYHKQQLRSHIVSQQRELLLAFAKHQRDWGNATLTKGMREKEVEHFLTKI